MNEIWRFTKTTLVGGLIFLLPFIVSLVVVVKAGEIALKVASPVAALLPYGQAIALTVVYLAGTILIALSCFLAGLLAQSHRAGKISQWLENKLLSRIPLYAVAQNASQSIAGIEADDTIRPVLVQIDEGWQIGFEIEPAGPGLVAVFMPGSPNPWSGAVHYVAVGKIRRLDVPLPAVLQSLKRFGRGSAELIG
jgi:uncharacterized membrane protein